MSKPICPTCTQESMIGIYEVARGCEIMYCIHCDLSKDENGSYVYQNHCWKCGYGIDSRFSKLSHIPGMGYICGHCGKDLSEWKLKIGQITLTELLILRGTYVTILQQVCN